ncbi:MAG: hypothetical protein Q9176_004837, partial [Flavoplaca citrina]
MDSPEMTPYGPSSTAPVDDFFTEQYNDAPPSHFENFELAPGLSDTNSLHDPGYDNTMQFVDSAAYNSQSSGTSPTSSSSSSTQHERHVSSNSSRSAPLTEDDSNRQMDSMFDFTSASNSPGGDRTQKSFQKPIRGMAMPQHELSPPQTEVQSSQRYGDEGPSTSPPAVSTTSTFKPENLGQHRRAETQLFESNPSPAFTTSHVHNQSYSMVAVPPPAARPGFVSPNNFNFPLNTIAPPVAAFPGLSQSEQMLIHKLTIEPISTKTRVETQIPVKMTLDPLPYGVTRIHLPARTMAKSKLIARPRPNPSPDTLELDVMPVCASAVKKPGALNRAYMMAQQKQPSSSEGPQNNVNAIAKVDPRDGGPISICDGCITRERKRANRRIEKEETAEDIMWKQGEKDRIVVFNESEVMEWKPFGSIDLNESSGKRGKSGGKLKKSGEGSQAPTFPPGLGMPYHGLAKQIRLPMRITCYCRHQGEPEGFQVIFTVKDYLGNCIAQSISSPILITDDHKTSAPQNEHSAPELTEPSRLPNDSFWPSAAPPSNMGPTPHLFNPFQSHSTTELSSRSYNHPHPALHRPSTSVTLQQYSNIAPATSMGFSTPSKNASYQTSATLTPRNLSRQVSPSATSGPTAKRRKASGSLHRPIPNLSMTRMHITDAADQEHRPSISPSSSSDASEAPAAASARAAPSQATPMTRQASLPINSEPMTGVSVSRGSGTQSPRPLQPFLPNDMNAHAQALHHSLLPLTGASGRPVTAPKVLDTIPKDGPVAGGIEVCIKGEGFFNGLEVLFADSPATGLIVQSSTVIFCTIPPATEAGPVQVTLGGRPQAEPRVLFHYRATDEHDIMSTALRILHYRTTRKWMDPRDVALKIIDGPQSNGQQSHSVDAQYQKQLALSGLNLESSILAVIDQIDQAGTSIASLYDLRQSNGQTMLHLSASLGFRQLAAGLLARGANPNCRDRNGMSPMHMACLRGHTAVIRMLLSAGGDPTTRSLLGLAPIDMAMAQDVCLLMSSIEQHKRSRSLGATPVSYLSRTNSPASIRSTTAMGFGEPINVGDIDVAIHNANLEAYRSHPVTPAQVWARSRRNSVAAQQQALLDGSAEHTTNDNHVVTAAAAMAAWRDNLASQIHHFQQSVQRTLPNLQVPNLPPLPTFEGYQESPMLRRISSLVPGRNAAPAPPSYDEIYPDPLPSDVDVKKASTVTALGDAVIDSRYAAVFDNLTVNQLEITDTDRPAMMRAIAEASTKLQKEQLRLAHAKNVKQLSNDRKLFFVW